MSVISSWGGGGRDGIDFEVYGVRVRARSAMMGDVSRGDGGVELGNEHQQHNTLWPVRISVH